MHHLRLFLLAIPFVICIPCIALFPIRVSAGETVDHRAWNFLSNSGSVLYLAAGVGLPLIEDGKRGRNHTLRSADALITSVLLSEGMKGLTKEKRPDSNEHDSFPSSHATAVFSVAAIESDQHPRQAAYWFAGATLISVSRVGLHRHTVGDVLAGAALGYGVARLELSSKRGLILAPFIRPEQHVYGLSLSKSF